MLIMDAPGILQVKLEVYPAEFRKQSRTNQLNRVNSKTCHQAIKSSRLWEIYKTVSESQNVQTAQIYKTRARFVLMWSHIHFLSSSMKSNIK